MGLAAPQHVGSSQTRDRTRVSCIGRQIFNHCTTREVPIFVLKNLFYIHNVLLKEKGMWLNNIYNVISMKGCSTLCVYTINMYLSLGHFFFFYSNISETQISLSQWHVMMHLAFFCISVMHVISITLVNKTRYVCEYMHWHLSKVLKVYSNCQQQLHPAGWSSCQYFLLDRAVLV